MLISFPDFHLLSNTFDWQLEVQIKLYLSDKVYETTQNISSSELLINGLYKFFLSIAPRDC